MFCHQCGKEANDTQLYCDTCGYYLPKETFPNQVNETKITYCKECGQETQGRYCSNCGSSNINVSIKLNEMTLKLGQVKQVSSQLSDTIKNINLSGVQSKVGKIKIDSFSKKNLLTWTKQGLVYTLIFISIALIISTLFNAMYQSVLEIDEPFWTHLQRSLFNTIMNTESGIFAFLFGGNMIEEFHLGGVIQAQFIVMVPFIGVFALAMIVWASEKIRYSFCKEKLTLLGAIIFSLLSALVIIGSSLFFRKTLNLNYDYVDYSFIQINSYVKLLSTLAMTFLTSLVTLTLSQVKFDPRLEQMIKTVKKIIFIVLGFSAFIALNIILRSLSEEAARSYNDTTFNDFIKGTCNFIYLTGVVFSMLTTGHFNFLHVLLNSISSYEININLLSISGIDEYGESLLENPIKWWLIVAILIITFYLLRKAYDFWKDRDLTIKEAIKEAGLLSIGVGLLVSLISKIASLAMKMQLSVKYSEYDTDLLRQNYHFTVLSGNVRFISTWLIPTITVFIVFMVMYYLVSQRFKVVDKIASFINSKVILVCIFIFGIMISVNFKPDKTDDFSFYGIENVLDEIPSEVMEPLNELDEELTDLMESLRY